MTTESFDTVIVGGGQAGLATGYHLKRSGRSFVILDASARIGDPWRNRWDSLRLYSPASHDGLPGLRFPAKRTSYPTTHEMADYLESYAAHFELPVRSACAVDDADDGRCPLRAPRRRPAPPGRERRHRDGGHAEAARAELRAGARSAGETAPLQRLPESLPAPGRAGARRRREPLWLGHRLRGCGASTTRSSPASTPARSRRVSTRAADAWASASCSSPDHTSSRWTHRWAARCDRTSGTAAHRSSGTGARSFSPPVSSGRPHERSVSATGCPCWTTAASSTCGTSSGAPGSGPTSRGSTCRSRRATTGIPCSTAGVVDSAPGLYFVGLLFLHSFTSMLVGGTGKDAERVATHIVSRRQPSPAEEGTSRRVRAQVAS